MSQNLDIFLVLTPSDSSKLICPSENAGTEGHIKSIRLVSMGQRGVTMVTQDHTFALYPRAIYRVTVSASARIRER